VSKDNQTLLKGGKKGLWGPKMLLKAIRNKVNMSTKPFSRWKKRVTVELGRAKLPSGTRSTCLGNQTLLKE
jgi:hypothetical protein